MADSVVLEPNLRVRPGRSVHRKPAAYLGRNLLAQLLHSVVLKPRAQALVEVVFLAKSRQLLVLLELHLQVLPKQAVGSSALLGSLALAEHKMLVRDSVLAEICLVVIHSSRKS